MSLPPLNALRAFEASARLGGYAAAARELNVSPSAISRFVRLLETRIGAALFERRPNGLTLTEKGAAYRRELTEAFAKIEAATARLTEDEAQSLILGAGPTLAMRWLIPRLASFNAAHPEIDVRVSTAIEGADPMKPGWTAAIRSGNGNWPGLDAHFLFKADLFPVCAPALARKLKRPEDLAKVQILAAANAPEDWDVWLKKAKVSGVDLARARVFDYPAFALQAAIDGLGVAMARAPFVTDDLAAGRLVRPFKLPVPKEKGWWLIHPPRERNNKALTALRAWLPGGRPRQS